MSEWITIKEKLPKRDEMVLLQAQIGGRMYVGYRNYRDIYKCITARGSEVTGLKPIAWMPLPKPYKASKK